MWTAPNSNNMRGSSQMCVCSDWACHTAASFLYQPNHLYFYNYNSNGKILVHLFIFLG